MKTTPVKSLADCPVISVQSVRSRTNMALFIIKGELSIIGLGRNGAVGNNGEVVFCSWADLLSVSDFK